MISIIKHLTLIFLLLAPSLLMAEKNEQIIRQANQDYSSGLYNNAIAGYSEVLNNGVESAELYYNLGNAYFKVNDMASAILFFERAKRLNYYDEDINHNLQVANNRIADKISEVPVIFYKQWWNRFYNLLGVNAWAKVNIAILVIFLIFVLVYFVARIIIIRKVAFWLGIGMFVFALSSFGFAFQKYKSFHTHNHAIVFSPSITIKSSPAENSVDLFVVHEGTKVKILDSIGEWREIKIANGSVGWIQQSAISVI